jgi:Tfp pilus assembly protein PilF
MKIPVIVFFLVLPIVSPPDGILNQAIALYEKGDYREAVSLLSSGGNSSNNSAELKFWLGKSCLKARKWDDAVKEMEKAVKMEPSNAMYHLWLGRAYGARAEHRIVGYNDARRLLKEFKKAAELAPDNITIRFDLLEYYAQAPGIVGGSKDKARREAEEISKLKSVRGYTARATIYEREKKWDLAKKEYMQATLDFPNDADTHKDMAQFLFDREDYENALSNVRKALELHDSSKQSRLLAAASQVRLGRSLEEAGNTLLGLAAGPLQDEDPAFENVYYWLGVYYFKKGEKEKSKKAFESALDFNPDHRKAKKYLEEFK